MPKVKAIRNGENNQKFRKNWLRGITQAYDVPKRFRILLLFTQKLPFWGFFGIFVYFKFLIMIVILIVFAKYYKYYNKC